MRQITSTGQVVVGSSATIIMLSNVPAAGVIIKNAGDVNVYVGNADVTITTGHLVEPHDAITVPVQNGVYGVSADGDGFVTFIEIQ